MKDTLAVRSLLVDKASGRLIKAIDELDLSDFIESCRSAKGGGFVLFDFAPAVAAFHKELERQLEWRDLKELVTARNAVFNSWVRFRSITKDSLRAHSATQLGFECEKVMGTIHSSLQERHDQYLRAVEEPVGHRSQKSDTFSDLMCFVNAFIETLLCAVHITAVVDVKSFENDTILPGHADALRQKLAKYIQTESNYWNGRFSPNSLIYQCCMEDMGIDVDALFSMVGLPYTKEHFRQQILGSSEPFTELINDRHKVRKLVYEWPEADPARLERIRKFALALQRITALSVLMGQLKNGEFDLSNKTVASFDEQVEILLTGGGMPARQLRGD